LKPIETTTSFTGVTGTLSDQSASGTQRLSNSSQQAAHQRRISDGKREKAVNYTSTRGDNQSLSLADIVSRGTAADGGLFVPSEWPQPSSDQLEALLQGSYADTAIAVLNLFGGDSFEPDLLNQAIPKAMEAFGPAANPPLKPITDHLWSLELFRGPTFAFKDYALAPLAEILDARLAREQRRATVLCATSGDTGAATVSAFANRQRLNVVVLFPNGGVSEFQRRQMTTLGAGNVLPLCVDGDFDDCQRIVKALYQTPQADEFGFTAVNSINLVRILLQSAYYFHSAGSIHRQTGRNASFIVPTGNFGNVYAAYIARQLGAPINRLVVTSNENDVLPRLFECGKMEATQTHKTISPSMDIQVSSNFERFLWHLKGKSGESVRQAQKQLAEQRCYALDNKELEALHEDFSAHRCSTEQANDAMRWMWSEFSKIVCPHSATAVHAARQMQGNSGDQLVLVETADPAKFSAAVHNAIGQQPPLPVGAESLLSADEQYTSVAATVEAVMASIEARLR
jgi:threonine synthase